MFYGPEYVFTDQFQCELEETVHFVASRWNILQISNG
jgi:hypothetical protein